MKKKAAKKRPAARTTAQRKTAARRKAATEAGEGDVPKPARRKTTAKKKAAGSRTKSAQKCDEAAKVPGRAHRRRLAPRIRTLEERNRVLELVNQGATYAEIGADLGCTKDRVHNLLTQIREDLELRYSDLVAVHSSQFVRQCVARANRHYRELARADLAVDGVWEAVAGVATAGARAEPTGEGGEDEGGNSAKEAAEAAAALADVALKALETHSKWHLSYMTQFAKLTGAFAPERVEVKSPLEDESWMAEASARVREAMKRRLLDDEAAAAAHSGPEKGEGAR